ncbi:hypothetical protein B0H13DRAFT_1882893 [Mycena leptocephala]|nr:hypothetical protein B0H13DRAFT_1882893 [Mycena leptocephala]
MTKPWVKEKTRRRRAEEAQRVEEEKERRVLRDIMGGLPRNVNPYPPALPPRRRKVKERTAIPGTSKFSADSEGGVLGAFTRRADMHLRRADAPGSLDDIHDPREPPPSGLPLGYSTPTTFHTPRPYNPPGLDESSFDKSHIGAFHDFVSAPASHPSEPLLPESSSVSKPRLSPRPWLKNPSNRQVLDFISSRPPLSTPKRRVRFADQEGDGEDDSADSPRPAKRNKRKYTIISDDESGEESSANLNKSVEGDSLLSPSGGDGLTGDENGNSDPELDCRCGRRGELIDSTSTVNRPGKGALARYGTYWYPVRLIIKQSDGWLVVDSSESDD